MGVKLTYNSVDYENDIAFEGGTIKLSHSALGETLSADRAMIPITSGGALDRLLCKGQAENDLLMSSDGYVLSVPSAQPAPVLVESEPGYIYFNDSLFAKMTIESIKQITKNAYDMQFYSDIFQLTKSNHLGGIYVGATFEDIVAEIIGSTITYTVDDSLKLIEVYGHLPIAPKRDNLQKLLMAVNGAVRKNANGSVRFTALSDITAGTFGDTRVFKDGTVTDDTPYTAVVVTEHAYVESIEEDTLYDGSLSGTETIYFNEPYHDLGITGGTFVTESANYCTFTASGSVTITGQKYIHITRTVIEGTAPTNIPTDKVKYITDNTLISFSNSATIAENFYDLLTKQTYIKRSVIVGTEVPGDVVSIINPVTKQAVSACMLSMDISIGGSILKGNAEFLVGYVPPGAATGYTNYVLLTITGTWTAPDANGDSSDYLAHFSLFGAGSGGYSGANGNASSGLNAGAGGSGGNGGAGGKVFEFTKLVTPGVGYSFVIGSGGTSDTEGDATTFDTYSSATGRFYPYGYAEPKTSITFCADGPGGISGAEGSDYAANGPNITYDSVTYTPGANYATSTGGRGGGAAVGNNGGPGDAPFFDSGIGAWVGGDGGTGANASIAGINATQYGCGGGGGNGGGGGGCAGSYSGRLGFPGLGGTGSAGGIGGDGAIVIYY